MAVWDYFALFMFISDMWIQAANYHR